MRACSFTELTKIGPNNLRTDLSRYEEKKVHQSVPSNLPRKKRKISTVYLAFGIIILTK